MTRAQVARLLNRSISTVRRMEGKELHPVLDQRGVNHFDREEVFEVAAQLRAAGRRDPQYTGDAPAFILSAQLRNLHAENQRLLDTKNDQLQHENKCAEGLLKIAEEALACARDSGSLEVWDIQARFDALLRALNPD